MCSLSMRQVQLGDAGRYVCIVTNDVGTTRDFAQLTVNGKTHSLYPLHNPVCCYVVRAVRSKSKVKLSYIIVRSKA